MNKKTVLIHSNFSKLFTGFGRTSRTLLRYLYKTGKYNLVEAANGVGFDAPECQKQPWPCHGTAPTQEQHAQINNNPNREYWSRAAGYGYFGIDKIVEQYRPDIVLLMEDYWAFFGFESKSWFQKTNPILWTTADSLPFQGEFVDMAGKYENLFCWSSFAEKEFKRKGHEHVKTLHGCIDPTPFYPLPEEQRNNLRAKFGIGKDTLVFGTVSRNQLRKGFPLLLDALVEFKKQNPGVAAKVFYHTSFQEGFNIPFLATEKGIDPSDVLVTYFCPHCQEYEVKPFSGHDQKCKFCGGEKVNTVSITAAPDDQQLNEVYNLFDIVVHPANSGGLEYVTLEGKLAGVPVCTTNYSYGEDAVGEGTGGFALDWEPYTEIGSSFTKAAVKVSSIVERLNQLYSLGREGRNKIGEVGRKYVLDNYSIDVIGKKWEDIIDNAPKKDWDSSEYQARQANPSYQPANNLAPQEFVLELFNKMMANEADDKNSQVKFWTEHLEKSKDYQGVYNHFVKLAEQHNAQINFKPQDFGELLDPTDDKRLLIIMPESAGDVIFVNSLVPRIKKLYPEFRIYFATKPQFQELVEHLPEIHQVIDYVPQMDDIFAMVGRGSHKGYFSVVMPLHAQTQRFFTYQNRDNEFRAEWL
jgi:glycosyltransferase involved in cell wall biosynthesis